MLKRSSSSCAVRGVTTGLVSLEVRSRCVRSSATSLYFLMNALAEASANPTLEGSSWYLLAGSFINSLMLLSSSIWVLSSDICFA